MINNSEFWAEDEEYILWDDQNLVYRSAEVTHIRSGIIFFLFEDEVEEGWFHKKSVLAGKAKRVWKNSLLGKDEWDMTMAMRSVSRREFEEQYLQNPTIESEPLTFPRKGRGYTFREQ